MSSVQTTIKPSWKVRPLRDDDLQGVAELAELVYREDPLTNVSYLDWKFNRNPSGKAIAAVCESHTHTKIGSSNSVARSIRPAHTRCAGKNASRTANQPTCVETELLSLQSN